MTKITVIQNVTAVTDQSQRLCDVLIENGRIARIEQGLQVPTGAVKINGSGRYLFPGLINTHTHLFQTLFKGIGKDLPLIDWLNTAIRPNMPFLDPQDYYWAALLGLIDSLESGTTTVFDYMYANIHGESFEQVLRAYQDVGMRCVIGRGWAEMQFQSNGNQKITERTSDVLAFMDSVLGKYEHNHVRFALAPTASWSMSQEGLEMVADYARRNGLLVTMHINETVHDNEDARERFGEDLVPFLDRIGLIGDNFLAVHGVRMSEQDMHIFSARGASLSYNPISNMLLGSGICSVPDLTRIGVNVCLGTDGAASNDTQNMLEVLKIGSLLTKVGAKDPSVLSARDFFKMATRNGALALGMGEEIGDIVVGKQADLFLFDPRRSGSYPVNDPVAALVYSAGKDNIDEVFVGGELIRDQGGGIRIDQERVFFEVGNIVKKFQS